MINIPLLIKKLNIPLLIKKYSVPFLFGVVGIILLVVGFKKNQSIEFNLAAGIILFSSILAFLTVSGVLSSRITKSMGFVSFIIAGIALFYSMSSVSNTVSHQNEYNAIKNLAIRNLRDVQTSQKAYKNKYNNYASSWSVLIDFINTDSIPTLDAEGSVPNRKITEKERDYLIQYGCNDPKTGILLYKRGQAIDNKMTDLEAFYLSKSDDCPSELLNFKRDTINVSFLETTFTKNRSYLKERLDNEFEAFNPKTLRFIPGTKNKTEWHLEISALVIGTDRIPTLRIEGNLPISKNENSKGGEEMYFGNLKKSDLTGSWEVKN